LGQRLQDVNGRLFDMVLPTLVERRHTGDHAGFKRALADSMRYLATAMLLPAAVGGGAAAGLMSLFGPGFERAEDALPLLLLVPALMAVATLQAQALIALERPLLSSVLYVVRLAATVAIGTILTLRFGITGMAIGMVAGCVLQVGLQARVLARELVGPVRRLWTPRSMVALGAAYAAAFACARLLDGSLPGSAGLLAAVAGGIACFAGVFLSCGGVLPRDRERLASLRLRRSRAARLAEEARALLEPQGVSQP
jgi:O-antigen/teichoic acid export membrane protein